MLKSRKEKQFLIFEFENGKDVRFDLSNGTFIGKKGRVVKSLTGQLSGFSIREVINSFEDDKYRAFLNYVYDNTCEKGWYGHNYSNLGTFLSKVIGFLNYEQFFACGLTNIDISKSTKMSSVPNKLIKLCIERGIKLTEDLIFSYTKNPNVWNILFQEEYEYFKVNKILDDYGNYRNRQQCEIFLELVDKYNYKAKSLARYIDNILRFEGENSQAEVLNQLYDYVTMMSAISNKFEKYPRYLRTIHNIAVRNYNRLRKEFPEDIFKKRINDKMEYTYKDWIVVYPKSTQDIKDEAVQQNNCVASYIDNVIDGKCDIVFLRKKTEPNKSVVTVEVRNNIVVQQKGRFNRDTNEEEKFVLNEYEKYLNKGVVA